MTIGDAPPSTAMKRYLFCTLCFASCVLCLADEPAAPPRETEIKQWIAKLGDDSFFVRERAEEHLTRIGSDALSELQKASQNKDTEVARRAEQIISRLENSALPPQGEAMQIWVNMYQLADTAAEKAGIIWILFEDTAEGEGLPMLLHIARFDSNRSLRAEAVKVLIGLPPSSPLQMKKWYQKTMEGNSAFLAPDAEQDDVLSLAVLYAKIRCELNERKENKKDTKDEALIRRVQELGGKMTAFMTQAENSRFQPGNHVDMLFYYALAEIQDAVGLTQERDKTVQTALAFRPEPLDKEHPLAAVRDNTDKPFFEHCLTGRILQSRFRLLWAKQHFQLAADGGPLLLQIEALMQLAELEEFLCNHPITVQHLTQAEELVKSNEYKQLRSNSGELAKRIRVKKARALAFEAEKNGDWVKVREQADSGFRDDPHEIDLLILTHSVILHDPELEPWYKDGLRSRIDGAVLNVEHIMLQNTSTPDERKQAAVIACNQAAWLLAGTGGSYSEAKALIDTALKAEPDEPTYLDTLAYVYVLGGEYEKAVQTQERAVELAPEAVVFRNGLERFRKMAR